MKITFGLISADSHAQLDRGAFTSRMSKKEWGERIPQVVEVKDERSQRPVDRWRVAGRIVGNYVANCPAVMNRETKYYPQRWEEVPAKVYEPRARAQALDEDGVDAEVLFPNTPIQNFGFMQAKDAEFELACVQAYNSALAEWRATSDRFVPLALIPYLGGIAAAVAEVQRAAQIGHRGVTLLCEPSTLIPGVPHINAPHWYPLWEACQEVDFPIHLHESGGLASAISFPRWEGFTPNQAHSALTVPTGAFPAEFIPNLIFSGILERFPRLKWVSAETGLGWVNYVIEGCDHEWQRRKLWKHGVPTRPSELFRRQIYVNFWFEKTGIAQRDKMNPDNIMWESDYPHTASTYPESWKVIEETMKDVRDDEKRKILCDNARRVYHLE